MNTPRLRFKDEYAQDFPDWDVIELEKIAFKVNKKNKDLTINNVLTNSATQGIVNQADYFDRDIANQNNLGGYYIVETDDFVYNPRISANAPVGPIKRNSLTIGVMSPLYTVFRFKEGDLDFFEQYFQTNHWHDYIKSVSNSGARHDRMNITNESFLGLPIPCPSEQEQNKIAKFLTVVDEKIAKLTQKSDLLVRYKKGVMQQIFSQQLRFKDDNGREFPEWEEKELGELCSITTGKLDANAMVENGEYRFYTCAKEYYQIDKYAFDTDALLVSGNGANVGYVHHYKGKFNAYQRTYVLDGFEQNIIYVRYFLDGNLYARIFKEKKDGNTPYIVLGTLADMQVSLPSLPEQTKIANFLNVLDDKINQNQIQLNALKQYKQGLLQQMFV